METMHLLKWITYEKISPKKHINTKTHISIIKNNKPSFTSIIEDWQDFIDLLYIKKLLKRKLKLNWKN